MRTISGILFAALLLLQASPARADQLADVKAKGQLICGVTDILDPFSYLDSTTGKVAGYDVEVCAAVAKRLGVGIEYKRMPLSARLPELKAGNVDILAAGLGYSPQRAAEIDFSHVYHVSKHMVIVKKSSGMTISGDVATRKIGFPKGSSAQGVLTSLFPKATIVEQPDSNAGYQALLKDEIEVFTASEILLTRFKNRPESKGELTLLEPGLKDEPWALGLRKGEPAMLAAVNAALDDFEKSGEAQALWDNWLGAKSAFGMKRGFKIAPVQP